MKKLLSLIAALTCLMTASVSAAPRAAGFDDVPDGAWYADAAADCVQEGILQGTSDTTFRPNGTLDRAMLATVLHRLAGSPEAAAPAFSDVPAGAWYADAVGWAAQTGVMSGYGGGRFGASDAVDREQFATVLWRTAGAPETGSAASFPDAAQISAWAANAAAWAAETGVVTGTDGGRFAPQDDITRAQAAVMLYRWRTAETPAPAPTPTETRTLVVYFSATGTTRAVAERAAEALGADLHEILPADPYTAEDLAYYTDGRCDREQADPNARPAIANTVDNLAQYDRILLGYPIWHGQAPRILSTFLEQYDLTGKTIAPFCTSASSGIGSSAVNLHALAPQASWLDGRRFGANPSDDDLQSWLRGLDAA